MSSICDFLFIDHINLIFMITMILFILFVVYYAKYRKAYKMLTKLKEVENNTAISLRKIIDTIPDPVYCKDADGIYTECNKEFEKVLGIKKEEIIGKGIFDIVKDYEQAKIYYKADMDLMKSKGIQIYETKLKIYDGSVLDAVYRKAAILSDDGKCLGIVGVIINVTESKINQKKIEKIMKTQEGFIQINQSMIDFNDIKDFLRLILHKTLSIIDGAEYGVILKLDENNNLKVVASKNYGHEKVENFSMPIQHSFMWAAAGGRIDDIIMINDIKKSNIKIHDILSRTRNARTQSFISTPIIIDGKLYGLLNIYSDKINVFSKEDCEVMKYVKVQVEMAISKHMLYEEKMYLSRYDKLTDLYNRRYFEELCKNINLTNEEFLNIVVFDINDLKNVNDNYGHIIGDEYIKSFANGLKRIVSESDIIARYGGDEFVGIFFYNNAEKLRTTLENLRKRLETTPLNEKLNIFCSFSFGIADFPDDGTEFNRLISIADRRMYEDKKEYKLKKLLCKNKDC